MTPEIHEDLNRGMPHTTSSNRAFGIVFAIFFGIVALWPLLSTGRPSVLALGASLFFVMSAFVAPTVLTVPKRAWLALGGLLQRITTPVALAILFFLVVTPVGILMRLVRRRPLALHRDAHVHTYWIAREPPGPTPESLSRQF